MHSSLELVCAGQVMLLVCLMIDCLSAYSMENFAQAGGLREDRRKGTRISWVRPLTIVASLVKSGTHWPKTVNLGVAESTLG